MCGLLRCSFRLRWAMQEPWFVGRATGTATHTFLYLVPNNLFDLKYLLGVAAREEIRLMNKKESLLEQKKKKWVSWLLILAALATIISTIGFVYDHLVPSPLERLVNKMEKNQEKVLHLQSVNIPDSLMTPAIIDMKECQQRILYYSKLINTEIYPTDDVNVQIAKAKLLLTSCRNMDIDFICSVNLLKQHNVSIDSLYFQPVVGDYQREMELSPKQLSLLDSLIGRYGPSKKAISEWASSKEFNEYFTHQTQLTGRFYEFLNILQLEQAYRIEDVNKFHKYILES